MIDERIKRQSPEDRPRTVWLANGLRISIAGPSNAAYLEIVEESAIHAKATGSPA